MIYRAWAHAELARVWCANTPLSGVSLSTKTEDVPWYSTDTTDVIAFQLLSGPGCYLVKNAQVTVLLENLVEINWGVLNLNDVIGNLNLGDDFNQPCQ